MTPPKIVKIDKLLKLTKLLKSEFVKIAKILTYISVLHILEKSVNFHITYKSHIIDKSQEQKK